MGPLGGGHDTETAHGGTDHCSPQGCPSGQWGLRALLQACTSDAMFYKWRTKYAGLEVSDV